MASQTGPPVNQCPPGGAPTIESGMAPPVPPILTSVTPNTIPIGKSTTVTVVGNMFNQPGSTRVWIGPDFKGEYPLSIVVPGTVQCSIDATAWTAGDGAIDVAAVTNQGFAASNQLPFHAIDPSAPSEE